MNLQNERRGFTLLEVMMAVAFLGLFLTVIFAIQAGAVKSVSYARNISVGTGLLRCKMSELEDHLSRDGFQETDEIETGRPCCDDEESGLYHCSWRIEKPTMPDGKFGDLNLGAGLDLGTPNSITNGNSAGALPLDPGSKPGDVAKALSGVVSGASPGGDPSAMFGPLAGSLGSGGVGGIAQLAMSLVYPSLKLIFEASSRRVTVIVNWREGDHEYGIDLMQWIVSPQLAGVTNSDPNDGDGGAPNPLNALAPLLTGKPGH